MYYIIIKTSIMKTKTIFFSLLLLSFLIVSNCSNAVAVPIKRLPKATITTYSVSELKKNIEYDFAKSSIRMSYDDRLDQLAKLMKDKNYAVALRGHADGIGSFKSNWVLSQKRADAVKAYLVSKGIPASKIISTAFGSTMPLASNKTPQGRQENRRVEIKLNGGEELSSR
jgi:outer membrane protein OmpA-like peptidoglycan-associated protein